MSRNVGKLRPAVFHEGGVAYTEWAKNISAVKQVCLFINMCIYVCVPYACLHVRVFCDGGVAHTEG